MSNNKTAIITWHRGIGVGLVRVSAQAGFYALGHLNSVTLTAPPSIVPRWRYRQAGNRRKVAEGHQALRTVDVLVNNADLCRKPFTDLHEDFNACLNQPPDSLHHSTRSETDAETKIGSGDYFQRHLPTNRSRA
jgi:hypothetical protein